MSTAPEADVTEHDGIEWKWCAQPEGSDFYDSLVRAVRRHTPRASLVLEIGVGAGYLLTRLNRDASCVCVGLDILSSAIRASRGTAAAGGATLRLLRGSGFALPIADSVFDVVMSHGVIEHYPPALARQMLAEHTRVCRPGGLVLVSVPNTLDLAPRAAALVARAPLRVLSRTQLLSMDPGPPPPRVGTRSHRDGRICTAVEPAPGSIRLCPCDPPAQDRLLEAGVAALESRVLVSGGEPDYERGTQARATVPSMSRRPSPLEPSGSSSDPRLTILGIADADYVHTHKWANHFAGAGHHVHLLSFRPVTAQSRAALHAEVDVAPWVLPTLHLKRPWITLAALARLKALERRTRPDLVHVHYLGHAAWYAALARMRPLVISIMGGDLRGTVWQPSSNRERVLTPFALRHTDLVLCWSRGLARCARPLLRPGTRTGIVVGGIDLKQFSRITDTTPVRRALGVAPDEFLVFSPRLFWPHYNIETIVRAMPLVLAILPRARLLLCKHRAEVHPDHEAAIERLIDELGVRHAIRCVPSIPNAEMPRYYSAADCTVSIPRTDGTPMTVMESAACGTPTIVLDLEDYDREVLVHGRTVIRISRPEARTLADAILVLATDQRIHGEISRDGRAMAERHADYHAEMGRLERLYETLAGERH